MRYNLKLSSNETEIPRGEEGYDPCAKYSLIYDVMVHNMNQLMSKGSRDVTMDETSWACMSFGSEVLVRVRNKPGITKGGQTVLLLESKRRYLLAYTQRHSVFKRYAPFTQEGPAELKRIYDIINPLIVGNVLPDGDKRRQIFDKPPHITMDNHFSGDHVQDFLGKNGWGSTCTCRRDRLPRGCKKEHFHHKAGVKVDKRSKCARYMKPIVAVKFVPPC